MNKIIVVCLMVFMLNACTVFGTLLEFSGIQGTHENPSLMQVGVDIDKKLLGKITKSTTESKGGCDTLSGNEKSKCIQQSAILKELISNRKNSSH